MYKNSVDILALSQQEIKDLAVLLLSKVQEPQKGVGKELFDAIISLTPQTTVEAVIVDNIDNPTKVLVTPRDDRDYPKSCHFPGGFIRYSETFLQRLNRLIKAELDVGVKKCRDTDIKYNLLEKKKKKHIIGFYFLVQLSFNPKVQHQWVDYIPKNLVAQHKDFLKSYFGWKEGKSFWR